MSSGRRFRLACTFPAMDENQNDDVNWNNSTSPSVIEAKTSQSDLRSVILSNSCENLCTDKTSRFESDKLTGFEIKSKNLPSENTDQPHKLKTSGRSEKSSSPFTLPDPLEEFRYAMCHSQESRGQSDVLKIVNNVPDMCKATTEDGNKSCQLTRTDMAEAMERLSLSQDNKDTMFDATQPERSDFLEKDVVTSNKRDTLNNLSPQKSYCSLVTKPSGRGIYGISFNSEGHAESQRPFSGQCKRAIKNTSLLTTNTPPASGNTYSGVHHYSSSCISTTKSATSINPTAASKVSSSKENSEEDVRSLQCTKRETSMVNILSTTGNCPTVSSNTVQAAGVRWSTGSNIALTTGSSQPATTSIHKFQQHSLQASFQHYSQPTTRTITPTKSNSWQTATNVASATGDSKSNASDIPKAQHYMSSQSSTSNVYSPPGYSESNVPSCQEKCNQLQGTLLPVQAATNQTQGTLPPQQAAVSQQGPVSASQGFKQTISDTAYSSSNNQSVSSNTASLPDNCHPTVRNIDSSSGDSQSHASIIDFTSSYNQSTGDIIGSDTLPDYSRGTIHNIVTSPAYTQPPTSSIDCLPVFSQSSSSNIVSPSGNSRPTRNNVHPSVNSLPTIASATVSTEPTSNSLKFVSNLHQAPVDVSKESTDSDSSIFLPTGNSEKDINPSLSSLSSARTICDMCYLKQGKTRTETLNSDKADQLESPGSCPVNASNQKAAEDNEMRLTTGHMSPSLSPSGHMDTTEDPSVSVNLRSPDENCSLPFSVDIQETYSLSELSAGGDITERFVSRTASINGHAGQCMTRSMTVEDLSDDGSFSCAKMNSQVSCKVMAGKDDKSPMEALQLAHPGTPCTDLVAAASSDKRLSVVVTHSQAVQVAENLHLTQNVTKRDGSENIKRQSEQEVKGNKDLFVETIAYKEANGILRKQGVVLITGAPWCGKQMIAKALVRAYIDEGFEPLLLHYATEIRQILDPKRKQVIMMRHPFGLFDLDVHKQDDLIRLKDLLSSCADSSKKFVFTCRRHIIDACLSWLKSWISSEGNIMVDISHEFELRKLEKRRMLFKHLEEKKIKMQLSEKEELLNCSMSLPFPKFCAMLVSAYPTDVSFEHYKKELMSLPKFHFSVLSWVMLRGKLNASDHLQLAGQHADLGKMASVVESLNVAFLKKVDDDYIFISQDVYDAVAVVHGSINPEEVIELCSVRFLCERIYDTEPSVLDKSINVQKPPYDLLAKRFVKEIQTGNLAILSCHIVLKNESFFKYFVHYCKQLSNFESIIESRDTTFHYPWWYWSVWNGDSHLFMWLINEHKNCKRLKKQITPEHMVKAALACCASGNCEVLRLMMDIFKNFAQKVAEKCVNVTQLPIPKYEKDSNSFTTVFGFVHTACFYGHVHVLDFLLKNLSLSAVSENKYGQSPIMFAVQEGHVGVVKYFLDNRVRINKEKVLAEACNRGQTKIVKLLLDTWPRLLHVQVLEGSYPIHLACKSSRSDLVKLLLEKGADVVIRDPCLDTALHCACQVGRNLDVLKVLNPSAEQINLVNKKGRTCLHLAARHAGAAMIEFLIERGGDVNAVDKSLQTPLHKACAKNNVTGVRKLLQHKADVFAVDITNTSPIRATSNKDIHKLLLKVKSDPSAQQTG